jgi:alpha-glucosidase (family GH31 glycosyl hydrolase)
MKHIRLLLIISSALIISSCKNEKNESTNENNINDITPTDTLAKQKNKAIDTIPVLVKSDSTIPFPKDQEPDSAKKEQEESDNGLKVVIDGKVYYKLYKDDRPVKNHKSHYYSIKINKYYDITTGKPVFIYGKHGKVMK